MTDIMKTDLEIIETYRFLNDKIYRVRIKGTKIVFNIHADTKDEALNKVIEISKTIGLTREIVEELKSRSTT